MRYCGEARLQKLQTLRQFMTKSEQANDSRRISASISLARCLDCSMLDPGGDIAGFTHECHGLSAIQAFRTSMDGYEIPTFTLPINDVRHSGNQRTLVARVTESMGCKPSWRSGW